MGVNGLRKQVRQLKKDFSRIKRETDYGWEKITWQDFLDRNYEKKAMQRAWKENVIKVATERKNKNEEIIK